MISIRNLNLHNRNITVLVLGITILLLLPFFLLLTICRIILKMWELNFPTFMWKFQPSITSSTFRENLINVRQGPHQKSINNNRKTKSIYLHSLTRILSNPSQKSIQKNATCKRPKKMKIQKKSKKLMMVRNYTKMINLL